MSIVVLAVAVLAGALYWRDRDGSTSSAQTTETYDRATLRLAAANKIPPAVMAERLRIASENCDVFRIVRAGFDQLATVCRANVVGGDPWWDGMSSRQLRDASRALILAKR